MTRYIERPRDNGRSKADATIYRFGQPLDELLKVARKADPDAEVVEVAQWRVLLVRHQEIPDHAATYTDYDVVADGHMLVYSHRLDVLYVTTPAEFEREWQLAEPA